jgi:hypothetical protein
VECQWYIRKVLSHRVCQPQNRLVNVEQHSKIAESEPIRLNFYRAVRIREPPSLTFRPFLYFCNDDDAPSMENESKWLCKRENKHCELAKC